MRVRTYELRHPTQRGGLLIVENPARPLPRPAECPACGRPHTCKTYHLRLDARGTCYVPELVYQALLQAGAVEPPAEPTRHVEGPTTRWERGQGPGRPAAPSGLLVARPLDRPTGPPQRVGGAARPIRPHGPVRTPTPE